MRKLLLLIATTCLCCSDPSTSDGMRGVAGGPCFDDGTCNSGLVCIEAICRVEVQSPSDAEVDAGLTPTDAEPIDAEPIDAEPIDAEPTDAEPTDAEPTDAEPIDAEPIDAEQGDAEPADATPIDAEPADAGTGDADSGSDAAPVPSSEGAFRITGLSTSGCMSASLTNLESSGGARGSDKGILGFTPDRVFSREYDAPWDQLDVGRRHLLDGRDGLVTDIGTATLYVFGSGGFAMDLDSGPSILIDELIALDDSGALTTNRIPMSLSMLVSRGDVSFFSGVGRVVVVTGGRIYDVAIPSGTVTDLGPLADIPDAEPCIDGRYRSNGVVERFGGQLHLVYKTSSTAISRYSISTAATSVVSTFTDIHWDCPFSFAPLYDRWLFAYARPDVFSHGMLGYCDGAYDTPGDPPPPNLASATPPSSISQAIVQISGTAEAGSLVELYDGRRCQGVPLASGTADNSGNFSIPVVVPANSRTEFFGRAMRSDGTRSLCAAGPSFVHDNIRPTFGGATAAHAFGPNVSIHWAFGADNLTPQEDLLYDVCMSTTSGGCSTFSVFTTSTPGSSRALIRSLTPGQTYYFVARVRDWAGTRDLNTIQVSATPTAEPSATFHLDSFSASNCETSNSNPWSINETVVSTAAVFASGENTVQYEIEDLQGGSLVNGYSLGYIDLVTDLRTAKVYALQYGAADFFIAYNPFPSRPLIVDNLVELDSVTGAKTSRRIQLSEPVQLFRGTNLLSGFGRLLIFNGERLVNVDLPGGEVTFLGHNGYLDRTSCNSYFEIAHGFVEDVGGALSFVFIDGLNRFARYDLATNTQAPIPNAPTPSGCSIGFSPLYSRWYRATTAQQNSNITACDADYSQPPGNPFDAGYAPNPDAGISAGPACTNGSLNDCNPVGSTFSPFVDPSPPPGYRQCAGFINGIGFDIESNWLDNCYPYRAGPLWIRVYNDATGALLSGARLRLTSCPGVFYAPDLQEATGFTDPGTTCQQGGIELDWNGSGSYQCTLGGERLPTKIIGYRIDGTSLLIGPVHSSVPLDDQNEAVIRSATSCGILRRNLRVGVYVPN